MWLIYKEKTNYNIYVIIIFLNSSHIDYLKAMVNMKEKEFLKQIGKQIARYRKERKMTQEELSDLCEMEQSALARIESGNTNVTAGTILKIGKALDVPVKEFFDFEY